MACSMDFKQRSARTALLFNSTQLQAIQSSHIMIFGLGGVGSYAAEALGRMGVGKLTIVDKDTYEASNINRQLGALTSTIGLRKTDITKMRLMDINPDACINAITAFHLPESPVDIPGDVDIVLDAVDTVKAKLFLIETCYQRNIPVLSCMGMGNRIDPTQIRIGDIFETSNCGLSRVMRKELRKRNITKLHCVYSTEEARGNTARSEDGGNGRPDTGSVAYVPSVAGLFMAHEAIRFIVHT